MFNRFLIIIVSFVFNFTSLANDKTIIISLEGSPIEIGGKTYCDCQQPLTITLNDFKDSPGIYKLQYKFNKGQNWNALDYYDGSIKPKGIIKVKYADLLSDVTNNKDNEFINRLGDNVYFRIVKNSNIVSNEDDFVTFVIQPECKYFIYRTSNETNNYFFHIGIVPVNFKDIDWGKNFELFCKPNSDEETSGFRFNITKNGDTYDVYIQDKGNFKIQNFDLNCKIQTKNENPEQSAKTKPYSFTIKASDIPQAPNAASVSRNPPTPPAGQNLSQYYINNRKQPFVELHIKDEWARAPYKLYKGKQNDITELSEPIKGYENIKLTNSDIINDTINSLGNFKRQINEKIDASDKNKKEGKQVWWEWESYYQQRYNEWKAEWCAPKESKRKNNMAETVECDTKMVNDVLVMGVEDDDAYIISCGNSSSTDFGNSFFIENITKGFETMWGKSFKHQNYEYKLTAADATTTKKDNVSGTLKVLRYVGNAGQIYDNTGNIIATKNFSNTSNKYTYETSNGCLALVKKSASKYDNSQSYHYLRLFGEDYATVNVSSLVSQQNVFDGRFYHFGILDGTYQNESFFSLNEYPTTSVSAKDIIKTVAYYDGEYIHYQGETVRQLGVTSIKEAGYDSSKGCYYVEYIIGSQRYRRNMLPDAVPSDSVTAWKNEFANQKANVCFTTNIADHTLNIITNREETYTLVDADGGKTEFNVNVTCEQVEPTSMIAEWDGSKYNYSMTLKYLDMGEMVYNNNIISRGNTLYIENLEKKGSIQLTRKISDSDSDTFTHDYEFGEGITKVEYTYCDSPGGTIIVTYKPQSNNDKISLYKINGETETLDTFITTAADDKNTEKTYSFSKLKGDKYRIKAVSVEKTFIWNDINIKDNTFAFNSDTITNATTIAGTGSAIFTVKNAIQNTTWTLDGIKNENAACTYKSKLSITDLSAKQYIVTATQSGCTISDTFNIEAPVVTGRVKVEQVNNEIAVTAKIDSVNELVEDLKIELCNNKSNDTLNIKYKPNQQNIIDTIAWAITNDKNGKNTIKLKYNGDNYWEVCTFTIADDTLSDLSLAYTIDTTVPKCFEQDLKFGLKPVEENKKNFKSNINGENFLASGDSYSIANNAITEDTIVTYIVQNKDTTITTDTVNINCSKFSIFYSRSRNDTIKDLYDNFHIDSLSAKVTYDDFLCSYSENADLKIDTIKGGFGYGEEIYYKYKLEQENSLIRDTTKTRNRIGNRTENIIQCADSGRYTVFIRDEGNNCKARNLGTYHVKRPSPITIKNIPTDPICELTANGTIQVEANGGLVNNKGYRYYIDTVYISNQVVCHNWTEELDSKGYGRLTNWPSDAMDSIVYQPTYIKSSQTVTFESLYPGIYKTIVLDSNNCVQTRTDTLRQYHNPYVTAAHYDSVRCYGEKNGHIVIDKITGSYPVTSFQLYKYNNDSVYVRDTNGIIVNSLAKNISTKITSDDRIWEYNADSAFVLIDSLYAGNYWIALTDTNKCSTPVVKRDLPFGKKSGNHFNIPVRQPDSLILSINDENNIIREYGKPGGSVNVNVSGGNKGMFNIFLDTKKDTLAQVIWGNHAFNDIFTPGTHKLYVTDHKECIDSATTKQMRQPDSPLSIEATPHDALCNGSFGSITVRGSGGWNGYQYSCSSKSNLYGANQNEYTFYDIKGGYYEVSVTDAEGVTATQKVYVNTPPKLMAVPLLHASSCKNDGLISANITGGTMPYLVKPDSSSVTPFYFEPYITNSNLTIIPKQLAAGDYSIVVVDSNNCEILMSATIADSSVKATVKPVYPTAHEFANGRLEAVVQQGAAPYTYQWKNHNTGQTCTNAVWDKVGAGVYSLEVTDANNCSVSVPITYLATNGYLPLIIDTIIGETAVGACNGMARFTSDTTGFKSIMLYGNSGVEKDVTSMVNNKLQFELTGLAPDSYLLECVLADTTVRYAKFTIARYEPMHLIVSNIVDVSKQDAANGSAKLRIDGGRAPFIVQMLRGDDFLADTVLNDRNLPMSGLTAANYTVSVVDESDNRINTQFIIRKPEKPLRLQAQSVENPSCNGYTNGRIILKATGGWGDYEYAAAEGEFGRATAYDGRGAAVHTFVAIDSKGTTDTLKVELVEPLPLTARVVQVDSVSCFGLTDGSVTFDIAGGTAPYTVHYDDFFDKKSNFVGSLNAGTHTFNITDSNFCRAVEGSLAVDIPQPGVLQVASDSVVHTTCNTDNGRIFITIAGGTAPYANSWREDGLIKERFANLTAIDSLQGYSLYEVEVADAKGCKAGKSYRINPSSGPKIERVRTLPVLCHGDSTGTAIIDSADIVPATPYSPFRIEWPHGENAMSVGNLPAGRNVVFVIDSNNCKSGTGFNVDAPSPIEIRKIGSCDASCYGYADGRISTLTLGGVGGYRYLWSNGDTLPDIDSIAKGAYTIVVADRNNCRDSAVFAIGQPDSLHVEIGEENVLMCPGNTYEFIPTDGFKTYRWILNDSTLSDKRNLIASEQGEYHLVATYGANCISRDTVTITIGDDLLEADFYMASDASKDNTIALVELSNMKTDSIRWDFSTVDFEVMDSSLYELQLKPNSIGRHDITLWAYSSGCVSYITKQVEISELPDTTDNIKLGYNPLIKSVTVKPNPTRGLFSVEVQLRESHDAEMTISSVSHGTQIEQRELTGEAEYSESFDLSNASDGVYILRISASDEHRVLKVLIAK